MALLKAFVLQGVLFGLYKLFLEQMVEEHLVPDELTRNCLVGFVCLLCFGIQLYTDLPDDENAETDDNLESKSSRPVDTTKFESAAKSGTWESAGLNSSCQVTSCSKEKTASQEIGTEVKTFNDQQIVISRERDSEMSNEVERIHEATHSGTFDHFSLDISGALPYVEKVEKIREAKVPETNAQTSYSHETKAIPVLNGFSESDLSEESDEDGIQIDQFVVKELTQEKAEQLIASEDVTEESKEVEEIRDEAKSIEREDVTENESDAIENKDVTEDKAMKRENVTEEATQLITVEGNKPEEVTEAVVESECLTIGGVNTSSTKDSDKSTTPKVEESSEKELVNGITEESFNDIDNMPSKVIKETESKISTKNEVGNRQDTILSSEDDDHTKHDTESLQSAQEVSNTNSTSEKEVNVNTMNKNHVETLTLVKTEVISPSEKITVSSTRHNIATAEDVCVPHVLIDISFIYACH